MSLIITVYTTEGIIMASDSRSSYTTRTVREDGVTEILSGAHVTDHTNKTYLCNAHVGLSACGDSCIRHAPLSGYIRQFVAERATPECTVSDISRALTDYFPALDPKLDTNSIVAGYAAGSRMPEVCRVYTKDRRIDRIDTHKPGATWSGESDILKRLLLPVYLKSNGQYKPLPNPQINFDYFTLPDAVDFAKYAIEVTMKTIAFQNHPKNVGGAVDILAIQPEGAFWVARKTLTENGYAAP